jgi:copper(I)-binding protein
MRTLIIALSLLALAACGQPTTEPPVSDAAGAAGGAMLAATDAEVGDIAIANAWAASTPDGVANAAAYLNITNAGAEPDRLVAASSARAARVELHEVQRTTITMGEREEIVLSMRPIEGIDLPPGLTTMLAPESLHLMFIDIDAPFVPGETVPVDLVFERAGPVSMEFPVHPRTGTEADHAAH